VCFGVDGVIIFQGLGTNVIIQMINKYCSFLIRICSMAHWCNLTMQTLSYVTLIAKIKGLFTSMYTYFNQSPKKHLENTELVEVIESRGLKILKNLWTRWISMLTPFKRLLSEYTSLVIKMFSDVVLLIKLLPLITNFCVMWKLCWD